MIVTDSSRYLFVVGTSQVGEDSGRFVVVVVVVESCCSPRGRGRCVSHAFCEGPPHDIVSCASTFNFNIELLHSRLTGNKPGQPRRAFNSDRLMVVLMVACYNLRLVRI